MDFLALSVPVLDQSGSSTALTSHRGKANVDAFPVPNGAFEDMLSASETELALLLPLQTKLNETVGDAGSRTQLGLPSTDVTPRLDEIPVGPVPEHQTAETVANAYMTVASIPSDQIAPETLTDADAFAIEPALEQVADPQTVEEQTVNLPIASISEEEEPGEPDEEVFHSEREIPLEAAQHGMTLLPVPLPLPQQTVSMQGPSSNDTPKSVPPPAAAIAQQVAPQHVTDTLRKQSAAPLQVSNAPVVLEARIVRKDSEQSERDLADATPATKQAEALTQNLSRVPAVEPTGPIDADSDDESERALRTAEAKPQSASSGIDTVAPPQPSGEPIRHSRPATGTHIDAPRQPVAQADEKLVTAAERTPLKQIDLRIPDANGDVTVRVQERAGAVQVTVRSADAQLAGGVAETLPDLARGLDREGFRAETWTPQPLKLADARADDHALGARVNHMSEPGSGMRADQSKAEDERNQSQREPDWQDEHERRRKRPQQEQDFKEYLW